MEPIEKKSLKVDCLEHSFEIKCDECGYVKHSYDCSRAKKCSGCGTRIDIPRYSCHSKDCPNEREALYLYNKKCNDAVYARYFGRYEK